MGTSYGTDQQSTYEPYPDIDYTAFLGGVNQVESGSYFSPDDQYVSVASVSGQPSDNGGIAQVLGNMWNWFNDQKKDPGIKAMLGGMLKGVVTEKHEDRKSKAMLMSAESSQLNAQTNAAADARKAANANAKVNFGLIDTPKFSDKLAVRRARSGAGLMGGAA